MVLTTAGTMPTDVAVGEQGGGVSTTGVKLGSGCDRRLEDTCVGQPASQYWSGF